MTIRIVPIEAEKTIKIYKNFNNIEISFLSKVDQLGIHQVFKKTFIEGPNLTEDNSEYIDEFTTTREKPFKKTLLGTIYASENEIIFEISDLKIMDKIDKSYLLKNPNILVKGNCRTVYGVEGKLFEIKEFKILVE